MNLSKRESTTDQEIDEYTAWSTLLRALAILLCSVGAWYAQKMIHSEISVNDGSLLAQAAKAFDGSPDRSPSIILGVLSSLMVGLVFGAVAPRSPAVWLNSTPSLTITKNRRCGNWLAIALVFLTLATSVWVNLLYRSSGETVWIRCLWGVSLLLLALAVVLGGVPWQRSAPKRSGIETSPGFSKLNVVILVCIVISSLVLRIADLRDLPNHLVPDVSHVGRFSYENITSGWRIFGVGFFGIPRIAFGLTGLSMAIFGGDLFGVRVLDVILGTVMIGAIYLCAWRSFDSHRIATVAAAVLATSAVHNIFSRHVFNLDPWALFSIAAFCVINGVRSYRIWSFALAGILVGCAIELYLSIRILFLILPCFVAYLAVVRPKLLWHCRWGVVLFLVGMLVFIGPNLADFYLKQETWKRSNRFDMSLLNPQSYQDYLKNLGLVSGSQLIRDRFVECLLAFQYLPDGSAQFELIRPFIDPWIAPLMWLGFGVSIVHIRRNPVYGFLVFSLILTMGLSEGLSYIRRAAWPRIFWTLPLASIFIAIAINQICHALQSIFALVARVCRLNPVKSYRFVGAVCNLAIFGLVLALGVRGWADVKKFGAVDNHIASRLARFIAKFPANTKVCLVPFSDVTMQSPELLFMGQALELKQIKSGDGSEAVKECGGGPLVWIVAPHDIQLAQAVKDRFPDAQHQSHFTTNKNWIFDTYFSESR